METSQVSKTCEVWVVWLNLNLKSSLLFRMATRASTGRMPVLRRWAGAFILVLVVCYNREMRAAE